MVAQPLRRALVTGAAGFIGAPLCRRLLEEQVEVHGTSRVERAGDAITWWRADLRDAAQCAEVMTQVRPDVVFHLAGSVNTSRELVAVQETLSANLLAAIGVMSAAVEHGSPRVVLAGSMEEPGADEPEGYPGHPYAASKVAMTAYAKMFHALYHLDVLELRIFMVYGPGETQPAHLVPSVIRELLSGAAPPLTSGRRRIDWVYVDDVVDALIKAARSDIAGRVLDVGSGERTSVREIVEHLGRLIDPAIELEFGQLPDRQLEHERYARVDETAAMLGWRATTPLDEGLRRTVEWYRADLNNAAGEQR